MKHIKTFESYVNEGTFFRFVSTAFEKDVEELIDKIKDGYGWIDPYYLEDTYFAMQREDGAFLGIPYNSVKQEIYKRLMKTDVLYFADEKDPEKKGKKVTSISQI
jgi:hypothetical protein